MFLIPWWIEPLVCTGIAAGGCLVIWLIARHEERNRE